MVLDIDHVLKEVGVGAVSQRAQLTFEELKTLWVTQSKFIEWAVLAGKVRVPVHPSAVELGGKLSCFYHNLAPVTTAHTFTNTIHLPLSALSLAAS